MFKGKKILFFSANFFGYQTEIKNKLVALGAEVDFFDERPTNTFLYKSLIRFDKRIIRMPIENYYRDIISKTKIIDYDFVLFIKAEVITPKILKELRQHQQNAKFILYLWDSLEEYKSIKKLFPIFDKILSFDMRDVDKYSFLHFRPLFYLDSYAQLPEIQIKNKNDVVFIGTSHQDRYPVLIKLRDYCRLNNIKNYFFIYLPDWRLYYLWKLFSKNFRKAKKSDFKLKPISKEEITTIVKNTICVIDIEKQIQSGLTMRALEVLGARRKLITTNATIKDYDFYNENNILIINRENPIISVEFIKKEYEKVAPEVYIKYSLEYWLNEVFN
jgi:hypothetical protein